MKVNGKDTERSMGMTLLDLVVSQGHDPLRIAVELNGRVSPRAGYADVVLKDDDVVEIVGFVGGG